MEDLDQSDGSLGRENAWQTGTTATRITSRGLAPHYLDMPAMQLAQIYRDFLTQHAQSLTGV